MLFSDKHNYDQVNWNDMVRNRCQPNILQSFEVSCYIFIFYLPINFKFLQDAISGIIFYIYMLPIDFMIEFVPNLKYLCFDLMFLQKINQVILVEILFFLDLRSVLRSMIFFVTFYFL